MIRGIRMKVSGESSSRYVAIAATQMVVVIGPNNSGKTHFIREIRQVLDSNGANRGSLVEGLDLRPLETEKAREVVDGAGGKRVPERTKRGIPPGSDGTFHFVSAALANNGTREAALNLQAFTTNEEENGALREVARVFSLQIPSVNRQTIMDDGAGDLSPLPALLYDRVSRNRLSAIVHDAIAHHLCIDAAPRLGCKVRLTRSPLPIHLEDSWAPEARAFMESQPELRSFSDGIQCFVGIVSAMIFGNFKIYTIDEPEAFLHPPLERSLGKTVAELTAESGAVTIASTHSPDFLMGCVQSGKGVTVIRLTYDGSSNNACVLDSVEVEKLMREPLLRSTGVLSSLFSRGAVVTEADADRAFYEEVNVRLLAGGRGVRDVSFMNGNGCQSIRRIVAPLRTMGLPAAAIVDLDVIKPKGGLRDLLASAGMPEAQLQGLSVLRANVEKEYGEKDPKKVGLAGLEDARSAESLIDQAARYGVFIVPLGELESWLSNLGVHSRKPRWLVDVFEKMGANPASPGYVFPTSDDVWEFMDRVATWINDPKRLGMPS